jgi:8-oxo-dGTP diphosphatase
VIFTEKPEGFVAEFRAVGCYIESAGDTLLLLRNKAKKLEPAKWGSPAGKIAQGETVESAMIREIFEETGLKVSGSQLKSVGKVFVVYEEYSFEFEMFKLSFPYKPEIRLSSEHVALAWVPPKYASSLDLVQDELEAIEIVYRL